MVSSAWQAHLRVAYAGMHMLCQEVALSCLHLPWHSSISSVLLQCPCARTACDPHPGFASLAAPRALCRWGITFTALVPAIGSIVWYGVIPVNAPDGDIRDKALWVFLINPVSFSFLSYLLLSLFFTSLDERSPHRPFFSYAHILAITYVALVRTDCCARGHDASAVCSLPAVWCARNSAAACTFGTLLRVCSCAIHAQITPCSFTAADTHSLAAQDACNLRRGCRC